MVKRVVVAVMMMCPAVVLAQAPQLLGYQGRLVKTDGTPESGNAQMRFGLFGTETGGSSLWEETQAVSITQGYYSTFLGRMTMFPATVFDTGTLWLEVAVQAPGDTQFRTMTPRQRVGSVAFALNARSVKGGTVDATSVSINGTQVIDSNGKLTASAGYTAGPGISIDGTTRAISVNSSGCNTGQVLQWNGSAWQCATVSGSGGGISGVSGTAPISVMNGTTSPVVSVNVGTTAGTVAAGNDSRFGNATSIGGVAVTSTAPTNGQVLSFNGTSWSPTSVATGGVASVTAGTGLTGGTITTTGTIAVSFGTGSGTVAQGNDSRFGNATTLQGQAIAPSTPATNSVLQWSGTAWTPTTLPSATGGSGLGRNLIAWGDNPAEWTPTYTGIPFSITANTTLVAEGQSSFDFAYGNVASSTGIVAVFGSNFIPVDPSRVYEGHVKVARTSGTFLGSFYAGFIAYNANRTPISGSVSAFRAGTTNCVPFIANNIANTALTAVFQEFSSTVTGEGTGNNQFPAGTRFIKPCIGTNVGGIGTTTIDALEIFPVEAGTRSGLHCTLEYDLLETGASVQSFWPAPGKRAELFQYGWLCWNRSGDGQRISPNDDVLLNPIYANWTAPNYKVCGRISWMSSPGDPNRSMLVYVPGYYYGLRHLDGSTNTSHGRWANGGNETSGPATDRWSIYSCR